MTNNNYNKWESYHKETRYLLVGSSHINRYPTDLFPEGHVAETSSYEPLATNFYLNHSIQYAINHPRKPDVIIMIMGGNDIACLPRNNVNPPSDNFIITAIKSIAKEIHENNIIPIVIPIPPREDTKLAKTGITRQVYERRRININKIIEKELTEELGYNPMPYNPMKTTILSDDKIHLSFIEYIDITKKIVDQVKRITETLCLRSSTARKERKTRPREENKSSEEETRRQRPRRDNIDEVTQKIQNKMRRWNKRERVPSTSSKPDETKESEDRKLPQKNKDRVLELANSVKSMLTQQENKNIQTATSTRDISTQTPSILEILPQILEDIKTTIEKHNQNVKK